ncbi:hypothetical protein [Herbiconiux sp. VKM Ac-2851]|uniref:hypothetical protein n=1 Tax=Herbiconiux sp. VKM Ac-2851 TaxID=2739025 RepID=UPI0015635178|nr:hypothetical protein [Herbiconiux sp. VKM Ac-2851]NQX34955.1 hypothetical protein [Herbiconiux sp. VKM Ac-2851]
MDMFWWNAIGLGGAVLALAGIAGALLVLGRSRKRAESGPPRGTGDGERPGEAR